MIENLRQRLDSTWDQIDNIDSEINLQTDLREKNFLYCVGFTILSYTTIVSGGYLYGMNIEDSSQALATKCMALVTPVLAVAGLGLNARAVHLRTKILEELRGERSILKIQKEELEDSIEKALEPNSPNS